MSENVVALSGAVIGQGLTNADYVKRLRDLADDIESGKWRAITHMCTVIKEADDHVEWYVCSNGHSKNYEFMGLLQLAQLQMARGDDDD